MRKIILIILFFYNNSCLNTTIVKNRDPENDDHQSQHYQINKHVLVNLSSDIIKIISDKTPEKRENILKSPDSFLYLESEPSFSVKERGI